MGCVLWVVCCVQAVASGIREAARIAERFGRSRAADVASILSSTDKFATPVSRRPKKKSKKKSSLCHRGCGLPPHRGKCPSRKRKQVKPQPREDAPAVECPRCGAMFSSRKAYGGHSVHCSRRFNQVAQPGSPSPFECWRCRQVFGGKDEMREHMKQCTQYERKRRRNYRKAFAGDGLCLSLCQGCVASEAADSMYGSIGTPLCIRGCGKSPHPGSCRSLPFEDALRTFDAAGRAICHRCDCEPENLHRFFEPSPPLLLSMFLLMKMWS